MNKLVLSLFIFPTLIGGCDSQQNEQQLQSLIAGFDNANAFIEKSNASYMSSLEDKVKDPYLTQVARTLKERAEMVLQYGRRSQHYIHSLKKLVTDRNFSIPHQLFDTLYACRQAMLSSVGSRLLQSQSTRSYNSFMEMEKAAIDSFAKAWSDNNFSKSNATVNRLMLYKIENDLLMVMNKFLDFYYQSTTRPGKCFTYFPIASMSSSCVKPGEPIELTVGVGAFVSTIQSTVTIDGDRIDAALDGVAVDTIRAKGQPGRHSIPVSIEYITPEGTAMKLNKEFRYTVVH